MNFGVSLLGGLGAAYQGYQQGSGEELERQQKAVRDGAERRRLGEEASMAPLQQEAKRAQLQSQVDAAKADAEVAPLRNSIAKRGLQAQSDLVDGNIKLAKGAQDAALNKQVYETISQVGDGAKSMDAAQTDIMAIAGKQLSLGNYNGINQLIDHVAKSPLIPSWNELGAAVKTEMATPPPGATDMMGNPAQGNALKITFDKGGVQWLNSGPLVDAYRQQLAASRKPTILKPGEVAFDPNGREMFKAPPAVPRGYMLDEDGNPVMLPGFGGLGGAGSRGAGSAGSAGGAAGGKAVDPGKAANDAWKLVATDSDAKLPPDVNSRGASLTHQLVAENSGMPPSKAAEIALVVAQDPAKVVPAINLQTGRIDGVYSDKRNGDVVIDRGIASAANPRDIPPEQMKTAVTKFLGSMKPEVRDQLTAAAFDETARKNLTESMFSEYDKQVQARITANPTAADSIRQEAERTKQQSLAALDEKLSLVSQFGTNPKAKKPESSQWSFGGLPQTRQQSTDPNSAAGRSQANQAKLREESQAKERAKNEKRAQLAEQFQRDKGAMEPLELARKYNELRGDLPTKEASELQQIERNIR